MRKIILQSALIAFVLATTGVVSNIGMSDPAVADKPVTLPDDWSQCVFPPYDC